MHSLIEEFFKAKFKNNILDKLADSAVIPIPEVGVLKNKINHLPEVILERDKERRELRSKSTQAISDTVTAQKRPGPLGSPIFKALRRCSLAMCHRHKAFVVPCTDFKSMTPNSQFYYLATPYEMCFTTDSYVVDPVFFPGGDIGKLSICGTINDLAVSGAVPLYISCGFIIEEGLEFGILEKIVNSMADTAKKTGVQIVTGDTKVVEKGKADKLFINTSGVGFKKKSVKLGIEFIKSGDVIIVNGTIGEHGLSVLSARENLKFHSNIVSDCEPLNDLIFKILEGCPDVKFMRDPTRGGLATTLNEIVSGMDFGVVIREKEIPVKKKVKALCEILGFDPMYIANEGKVVIVTGKENSDKIIEIMRKHPFGKDAAIIGEVVKKPEGKVILETEIGSHRIVDMPVGEQFPRIC